MRKLYNMIALVMISSFIFAQGSVSGTVTDENGNALFGANVTVEGTSSGAATGADGSLFSRQCGRRDISGDCFIHRI